MEKKTSSWLAVNSDLRPMQSQLEIPCPFVGREANEKLGVFEKCEGLVFSKLQRNFGADSRALIINTVMEPEKKFMARKVPLSSVEENAVILLRCNNMQTISANEPVEKHSVHPNAPVFAVTEPVKKFMARKIPLSSVKENAVILLRCDNMQTPSGNASVEKQSVHSNVSVFAISETKICGDEIEPSGSVDEENININGKSTNKAIQCNGHMLHF
ncbi:hypothetical protein DdX_07613 [Ditylenchus destructor]|uniref:Uncharacterized protein n=1 Tax=Ditylenchus destructor TaxID=166010 RepID=A0AAD4R202_9BILA|nr:hypothetical protein DdX_07613 [Ditylenchus destructor]